MINFIVHFYLYLYFYPYYRCVIIFKLITIKGKLEIPPFLFDQSKEVSARIILNEDYSGTISREYGFVIAVVDVLNVSTGQIIPGSANTFHEVEFTILAFKPTVSEVVEGEIVEIVDFGAFIRLGPLDGLVHVSQITDDYISYEQVGNRFIGKETGKILEVNDIVRAKVIAVSLGGGRSGKLGLSMRSPYLGKTDWIEDDIENYYEKKKTKEAKEAKEEVIEG
ncbi:MAG: DNA-directed RNA polymerase [Candidatus Lokiarchaeota archaeon]|nr:DNA-directed RNA polymerase [Candidatus Lokiarchaeota archaeon]MBD3199089.1 DNA-directed RNA polymerase [Candidatus Lokiarchaeota archaeon]